MGQMHINFPREKLAEICRRFYVHRMSLFGSVLREDFGPDSDVDVLVEFEPGKEPSFSGLLKLQGELSVLFDQRSVDVATPSILRNPYRRKSILKDLQPIYGA
jgi:predicted nucleotidyltransferase